MAVIQSAFSFFKTYSLEMEARVFYKCSLSREGSV